jgi:hypothetical protein
MQATANQVDRSITARVSSVLQRLSNVNNKTSDVLIRLRGEVPSPVGEQKMPPEPPPNIEVMLGRLESFVTEAEEHASEFVRLV